MFRTTFLALTAVALIALAGLATGSSRPMPANESGEFLYLVTFDQPGAKQRMRTAGAQRQDAVEILQSVRMEQTSQVRSIQDALDRSTDPVHSYLLTHSGVSLWLHPDEAERLRELDGVAGVVADQQYELATFRGPSFIGADTIWQGDSTPDGVTARGENMIVAVLDSGLEGAHPSFADSAECGFGAGEVPSKLLSNLDCSSTDSTGLCNGADPSDAVGHGTHVAGTAVGNRLDQNSVPAPDLPSGFTEISGVSPCAHLRSYKVCPGQTCSGAWIIAGMNSVMLHGDVDVMNFSISGGNNPWLDNDRLKLDLVDAGIFVAASAGNTGPTIPDPVGQVNHRGPWVMSVASVSHDGVGNGLLSVTGPGQPPTALEDMAIIRGSDSPVAGAITDLPIKHFGDQPDFAEGCTPGEQGAPPDMDAFPAGFFDQSAALIRRGTCDFPTKIGNAFDAGAELVVIRNNESGAFQMATPGQAELPAYSMAFADGEALQSFLDDNPGSTTIGFSAVEGDVLSLFSLRGPTPSPLENLTKPDVAAPGDQILAPIPGGYDTAGGTSMASPHVAGAATLLRQLHPDWSVSEVGSALATTAYRGGVDEGMLDNTTPDEVGGGRIDVGRAVQAGLVLDEQTANYLAADPDSGGDVRTLNLPALRDMDCSPECSWTRTVRNTLASPTQWQAQGQLDGFVVTVSPSSFEFVGAQDETRELTITAVPDGDQQGAIRFGAVELTEVDDKAPQQHLTMAARGLGESSFVVSAAPDQLRSCLPEAGTTTHTVDVALAAVSGYTGAVALNASQVPAGVSSQLPDGPISVPGDALWELAIDASVAPGSHTLLLGADDGQQQRQVALTLDLARQLDDAPTLIGPPDAISDIGLQPEFSWQMVENARSYWFELATDADFNDVVVEQAVVDDTFQLVTPVLTIGTEYFWRVRADNACGSGEWSEVFSLSTRLEPQADVSQQSLVFTTASGASEEQTFEVANAGTGNLVWQIESGRGQSGSLADAAVMQQAMGDQAEFDEVLNVANFTIKAPINGGTVVKHSAQGGRQTRGEVIGFRFSGQAGGVSGSNSQASDTCLEVRAPGGERFTVGGSVGATPGCGERPWDFQGEASADDGSYQSEHALAFAGGTTDQGEWRFRFSNDWTGSTATDIHWTDATITLLKTPWPYCENPADVSWLTVSAGQGSTAQGESEPVVVKVDGSGMSDGRYFAALCLTTNDPDHQLIVIPVTFNHGVLVAGDALFRDRFSAE